MLIDPSDPFAAVRTVRKKNKSQHLHHSPRSYGKIRFTCACIGSCDIHFPFAGQFCFPTSLGPNCYSIFPSAFIPDMSNKVINYKYGEWNKRRTGIIFISRWRFESFGTRSDRGKLVRVPRMAFLSVLWKLFSIPRLDIFHSVNMLTYNFLKEGTRGGWRYCRGTSFKIIDAY